MPANFFSSTHWTKKGSVRYSLGTYEQMLSIATAIAVRPAWVNLLGCSMCKTVCADTSHCKCCMERRLHRRAAAGVHVTLMPTTQLIDRMRELERKGVA